MAKGSVCVCAMVLPSAKWPGVPGEQARARAVSGMGSWCACTGGTGQELTGVRAVVASAPLARCPGVPHPRLRARVSARFLVLARGACVHGHACARGFHYGSSRGCRGWHRSFGNNLQVRGLFHVETFGLFSCSSGCPMIWGQGNTGSTGEYGLPELGPATRHRTTASGHTVSSRLPVYGRGAGCLASQRERNTGARQGESTGTD